MILREQHCFSVTTEIFPLSSDSPSLSVYTGGGVNGSNVPGGVGAVAGGGLMMLNGAAAVNPAASGLLMPNTPTAGNTGMLMHRPVMLPSAGSPATAGYVLAGGAGATAPTLPVVPQCVVGYPQQTGTSQDLTAMYGAANPYGVSLPPAAVYGLSCLCDFNSTIDWCSYDFG